MVLGAAGRPAGPILKGQEIATQQPGTKLTIISGFLRGRRCVHQADVFDKWKESPYPDYAFRVRLVGEDGQEY